MTLTVRALTQHDTGVARASFTSPSHESVVEVRANVPLSTSTTPWLAPGLAMAMRVAEPLRLVGPVDPTALASVDAIRSLLASWYDDMTPVQVDADPRPTADEPQEGVACFFSGGVDSFYSALEIDERVSDLVFVHGFDIPVDDTDLAAQALAGARLAAEALGKRLIEVRTDLRPRLTDALDADWGTHAHGAALALVGNLLDRVGTVVVPASYHVDDLFPWGSHPDLDPLWSTSRVQFEHHGTDVTRVQKVAAIARHQVALDHLRVCWENRDGAFNCGRCEKCLRTMITLRVLGVLDRCGTLPPDVDLDLFDQLAMGHVGRIFAADNLRALREAGTADPELELVLERALRTG